MTDAPTTEPQAGSVCGRAREGGAATAVPPTHLGTGPDRVQRAYAIANSAGAELAYWGRPTSGFELLARAALVGAAHVGRPEDVALYAEALAREIRATPQDAA